MKNHNIQPTTQLSGPQWTLKSSDGAIYKEFSARIYMQQHEAALKHHIKQKHGYTEEVMNSIDWKSIGNAGQSMPIYEKSCLTKHVGRYSATGRQMKRRKEWKNSNCPRCGCDNEDSNHITECQAPAAIHKLHDEILKFERDLDRQDTSHSISDIITTTLFDEQNALFASHILPYDGTIPEDAYELICRAAHEQDAIGQTNLLHGHLATKRTEAQELIYWSTPGCRRNGRSWAKQTIRGLYRITKAMWEHRNDELFPGTSQISTKRKRKIWEEVEIELDIGNEDIRMSNCNTACMNPEVIKEWSPESQDIWVRHIQMLRERDVTSNLKQICDNDQTKIDEIFRQRLEKLRHSSSTLFHHWRMKFHTNTLAQYLHSTEELQRQLKRQKVVNC